MSPQSGDRLYPIASGPRRRGILNMTAEDYFDRVDQTGRMTRPDKRGAKPETRIDTVSHFHSKFRPAAGLQSNLRKFAGQVGRRWLQGVPTARSAFASRPRIWPDPLPLHAPFV